MKNDKPIHQFDQETITTYLLKVVQGLSSVSGSFKAHLSKFNALKNIQKFSSLGSQAVRNSYRHFLIIFRRPNSVTRNLRVRHFYSVSTFYLTRKAVCWKKINVFSNKSNIKYLVGDKNWICQIKTSIKKLNLIS